jgi:hypothetical protein
MEHELTKVDRQILEHIDAARAVNHAVTARQLGSELKLHNSYISRRLHTLRELGYVDFNEKVPGAIWVAGTIEARHNIDGVLVPVPLLPTTATAPAREIRLGVHSEKMQPAAPVEVDPAEALKAQRRESLAKARAAKAAKKTATAPSPK